MDNIIFYIKLNIKPKEEIPKVKETKIERAWKLLKKGKIFLPKEPVKSETTYRLLAGEEEIDVIVWDYGTISEDKVTKEWIEAIKKKAAESFSAIFNTCYSLDVLEYIAEYSNEYSIAFLKYIFGQLLGVETIFMKDEELEGIQEFAESIYEDCNKMVIWIPKEEDFEEKRQSWEDLSEYFYENTGLAIEVLQSLPNPIKLEKDKWKKRYKTVFFDFSHSEQISHRQLPKGAIYIDFYPNKRKKRILTVKRSDLTYLTYANFLDINAQNTV